MWLIKSFPLLLCEHGARDGSPRLSTFSSGGVTSEARLRHSPGCLAPFRCSRASLWVQPGDLVPTLQPARTKGTVHLKHDPLLRPEHSDSCQCAVQRQKPDLKLKLWISREEKASTTALFCSTSYPGNSKAEFTVFLWLTRFEFIPPRSTGGYMNLQAHLGRKMPPHLFKLNFCAARHAEFMALKGRAAEEPNSLSGNKNNCVSRCVNRILCAHSTLHWHWREKVIQQKKESFSSPGEAPNV